MDHIQVQYNSEGQILLILGDHGLELSREEAEALFVNIGYCLTDMDAQEGKIEIED